MKKAVAKAKKSKVAIKDLAVAGRKGASKACGDVKGGFAPQPEPPKEIITRTNINIRQR
jgi:hypothetical protein